MSFLLDTDICSAYLRKNDSIAGKFLQYGGRLHVSTITSAELLTWGLRTSSPMSRLTAVREFLTIVRVLDVDSRVAEVWATVRARQLDNGLPSPRVDLLIAATALLHGLTLVTHNTKDFEKIPDLQLADWLLP